MVHLFREFCVLHRRCQCNGHAEECNKHNGEGCPCEHNTQRNPTCQKNCYSEQVIELI